MTEHTQVCILNIDKQAAEAALPVFTELSVPCKTSKQETDLCKATHIVIPPTPDISTLMKKMHMFNLHSLFRMMKKPVLLCGSSLPLMFESAPECSESMLGYLNNNYCQCSENIFTKSGTEISRTKPGSILLAGLPETFTVFMDFFCPLNSGCEFSSAVILQNQQYSAIFEKHPFYGVIFNPFTNGPTGKKIIENFIAL